MRLVGLMNLDFVPNLTGADTVPCRDDDGTVIGFAYRSGMDIVVELNEEGVSRTNGSGISLKEIAPYFSGVFRVVE